VVPDASCREAQYIYLLGVFLVIRTMLSIWLADVNGHIVKTIVNSDFKEFVKRVSPSALMCADPHFVLVFCPCFKLQLSH